MAASSPPRRDEPSRGRAGWWVLAGLFAVGLLALAAYVLNGVLFDEAPERIAVPNVVGMTEEEARLEIVDAGFTVGRVSPEPSETVEAGRVISQDPNRDVFADPGTSVDLVVSLGRPEVAVPSVVGSLRKDARAQMLDAGLKVRFQEEDSDEDRNQVLSTSPPAGTSVAEGTTIVIVYSDGPEKVPDVRGLRQGEAERMIREAGFVPDVRTDAASTEPKGTVVDQIPLGGTTADQNSPVTIFVSAFEEPVSPTPTPTETPTPTATPTTPSETPTLPNETPTVPPPSGRRGVH